MRRAFWMMLGLGAGVTAAVLAGRWLRRQRERLSPANIASQAAEGARDLGRLLGDAVSSGREAMRAREAEIWSEVPE